MPKYYEDIEEISKKKNYACQNVRDDLLECLLKVTCMNDEHIKDECVRLRVALFECQRCMLDVRTRLRGRKDY
ncbi:unnamed protein product [Candidula unifasciata]|uniref:Cytochrome c oxidase assembly factor 5 n=1 Tax=Candidula unifasciata TaxID=100452 RepID=A0A8S3Z732_9EUPU|nr:unnamed protein product [Candidula unifasciata]